MKIWIKKANHLGIFLALFFILCFAWFWIHPVQKQLHLQLLEFCFFGYKGMNVSSFFLGLIQSYIWGYIGLILWSITCPFCSEKKKQG